MSIPNGFLELGPRPKGGDDADDASDNPPPGDEELRQQKEYQRVPPTHAGGTGTAGAASVLKHDEIFKRCSTT
jgi:hypothetical protein